MPIKKATKRSLQTRNWTKIRKQQLETALLDSIKALWWQSQEGTNLFNIHMLDTIQAIHYGYLSFAAHHDAVRDLEDDEAYRNRTVK